MSLTWSFQNFLAISNLSISQSNRKITKKCTVQHFSPDNSNLNQSLVLSTSCSMHAAACHRLPLLTLALIAEASFLLEQGQTHNQTKSRTQLSAVPTPRLSPVWVTTNHNSASVYNKALQKLTHTSLYDPKNRQTRRHQQTSTSGPSTVHCIWGCQLKEKRKSAEHSELMQLKLVSLAIRKERLGQFTHVHQDNTNYINCCRTIQEQEIRQGTPEKTWIQHESRTNSISLA